MTTIYAALLRHKPVKYQLLPGVTLNPAATSAADWDGAVAGSAWTADVAVQVRLVDQVNGVIYTLTTTTTCTATGETALHGAELIVTDSALDSRYKDVADTGAAALALLAQPVLSNAIVAPYLPPMYRSTTDLALSTDAATAFSTITLPTLTPSRNYSFVARVTVSMAVDSDSTGSCEVYVRAKVHFETDSSGVPINVTVDPAPSINNTEAVPSGLLGVTANVAATTGGVNITATRKSGIAMHASYECHVQNFKDWGAASVIILPTDVPGLLWWYKSGALVSVSGTDLLTWGDSSGNNCTGTCHADSGKNKAQYSATGGPGLAGARIILADGHPNALWLPSNWLNTHDPALTALYLVQIFKRAADPPATGQIALHAIGSASSGTCVPFVSGTIYDGMGSTTRQTAGATAGATASTCCYAAFSGAGEWTNWLNGTQKYTKATNTVGFDNSPRFWVFGDDPHTAACFVGEYYECFAYDHKPTPQEFAALDGYVLTGKSGAGGFGVHLHV